MPPSLAKLKIPRIKRKRISCAQENISLTRLRERHTLSRARARDHSRLPLLLFFLSFPCSAVSPPLRLSAVLHTRISLESKLIPQR